MRKLFYLPALLTLTLGVMAPSADSAETTYKLGVVPQFDARRIRQVWMPIIERIKEESGITLELVGSPSIPEFEKGFTNGDFDFAYMNPYHMLVSHDTQGYEPIIRDTARKLYGVIVVRKDSPITSVEQLDGQVVALPAPNALGAALIPRTEFATRFKIKPEYVYVKSHSSVYLNVLLNKAVAGGGVQKTLSQQRPQVRDNLRILYETTKVPPHPIAVHPRVPAEIRDAVQTALLAMMTSAQDSKLLAAIPIKKAGKASLTDYEELRSMGLANFYVN